MSTTIGDGHWLLARWNLADHENHTRVEKYDTICPAPNQAHIPIPRPSRLNGHAFRGFVSIPGRQWGRTVCGRVEDGELLQVQSISLVDFRCNPSLLQFRCIRFILGIFFFHHYAHQQLGCFGLHLSLLVIPFPFLFPLILSIKFIIFSTMNNTHVLFFSNFMFSRFWFVIDNRQHWGN